MKRSVLLSSFLVAAVLSPVALYGNTCLPFGNAKLAVLQLRVDSFLGENTIEGFDPDVLSYDALFPESDSVGVLWVKAQDLRATIEVEYDGELVPLVWHSVAKLDVPLGSSELAIHVSANPNGSAPASQTYVVRIRRGESCEQVGCDDKNECTDDVCNPSIGLCENTPVQDGSPCAADRGGCYGGLCNFRPLSVTLEAKEVVFDWSSDRCEDLDVPDGPARFVRAQDGEIVVFAPHYTGNFLSRGVDFDALEHVCNPPALVSADSPLPDSYENWEWLWAPYREGADWHVLVHNEFHDPVTPTCQQQTCVYNSITYAVSTDGGHTFGKTSPPAHVVAPAPDVWTPPGPGTPVQEQYVEGAFEPSNIVQGPDDYYYSLFQVFPHYEGNSGGMCPMRTQTLGDPASWRAWDGSGFNLPLLSPYTSGGEAPVCSFVTVLGPDGTPSNIGSLTYNTYIERYVWVAAHRSSKTGEPICGFYLSTSVDLIHWSDLQLITEAIVWCDADPAKPGVLEPVQVQYPSVIDHEDSTTNFERPGQSAYLYYTRHNDNWLDRDLVRVPLTFTLHTGCEGVDCDDQNRCTEDTCDPVDSSCENTPIDCVDFNDCTADTCDPAVGCEYTSLADGTPCAGGACQAGACQLTSSVLPCTEQGIRNALAAGGGPYTFACDGSAPVVTTAEIVIDNDVILDGEGKLTVDGNADHRVFSVAAGVEAGLIGFTVTGGSTLEDGGGIGNAGTLTLANSVVSGNTARFGGGIRNEGQAHVIDTTVSNNFATQSTGGISNRFAAMTLTGSTVHANVATGNVGGISNNGTLTLNDTTVSSNEAGGEAGGIRNISGGTMAITNSTVSGNQAADAGGGIFNEEATMTLVSTTVAGNAASLGGTGIWNNASITARNTIIDGDCAATPSIVSLGGNIESEGNTCGLGHPTDQVSMPAPLLLLGRLQDNGGPTMTHALLPGSEAIDWIPEAMCIDADGQPLATDQRGQPRPAGPGCDAGSFEVQP